MSILGWIGKRIEARIEAMPSFQAAKDREERLRPVLRASTEMAQRPVDDETAKDELVRQLAGKDAEVVEVLKESSLLHRDTFLADRAYRLLAAIASSTNVEPMPVWRASLFEEEAGLGRMPMQRAFHRLAEIEPRLLDVERRASQPQVSEDDDWGPKEISRALRTLVGGGAKRENGLLRSSLASSIAHNYLWIVLGEDAFGSREMPYFDSPRKMVVATAVFGRGARRPGGP